MNNGNFSQQALDKIEAAVRALDPNVAQVMVDTGMDEFKARMHLQAREMLQRRARQEHSVRVRNCLQAWGERTA
jgi:hypothetical protein